MLRLILVLGIIAVGGSGCVPVTEPVGDIEKAEPNKDLVGLWAAAKKPTSDTSRVKIDLAPEVKGNPKGLMQITFLGFPLDPEGTQFFFFLTAIGKDQYGNLLLDVKDRPLPRIADFRKEGDYGRWARGTGRRYVIFRAAASREKLILNWGDEDAFGALMKDAKIPRDDWNITSDDHKVFAFRTPTGWLAKYLEKNGPGRMFPEKNNLEYEKQK